jgi:hypothetical protein
MNEKLKASGAIPPEAFGFGSTLCAVGNRAWHDEERAVALLMRHIETSREHTLGIRPTRHAPPKRLPPVPERDADPHRVKLRNAGGTNRARIGDQLPYSLVHG